MLMSLVVPLLGAQSLLEPSSTLEFVFQNTCNSLPQVAYPCSRIPETCVVFFLSRLAISSTWLPFSPSVSLIP